MTLAPDDAAQPLRKLGGPACLVDEVDGPRVKSLLFELPAGTSSKENNWQAESTLLKNAKQIEARHMRQAPIEQRRLCRDATLQGGEQSRSIRKPGNLIPAVTEVRRQCLSIQWVVIHQDYVGWHSASLTEAPTASL